MSNLAYRYPSRHQARLAISVVIALGLAFASRHARADESATSAPPPPAVVAATIEPPAPDITLAPHKHKHDHVGSKLALFGVAAVVVPWSVWEYFAWFHGAHRVPFWFDTACYDECFSRYEYSGMQKVFGHAWAAYVLQRGTTELLVATGWDKWAASLLMFSVSQLQTTFAEIKDGYVWGYESDDSLDNFLGGLLGLIMENSPTLDRMFDFRLEYWPSHAYIQLLKKDPFGRGDGLDFTQDYSGQTYILAYHLRTIPHVLDSPWTRWMEFADLTVGRESRHYEPTEPSPPRTVPLRQTYFIGMSINIQAVLDHLLPDSKGRRIGKGIFEVFDLPITTIRAAEYNQYWSAPQAGPAL